MSTGSLVTMYIMHCLAVKLLTMFRWAFAARWHRPTVALAIVEVMIDVAVEMIGPVIPRSSPDKDTAREPLRAIIAIGGAPIRAALIVPIWTNGLYSNTDR